MKYIKYLMKFAGDLKQDHYRKGTTDILGTHSCYYYANKRYLSLLQMWFFTKDYSYKPCVDCSHIWWLN